MTLWPISARHLQAAVWMIAFWGLCALGAWVWLEPQPQLVGARQSNLPASMQALEALTKPVVAVDLAALERVKIWGMERNGQPPAAAALAQEKKVLWHVTARVIRPDGRYLVLYQPESKVVQQVRVGDLMPDGSKLTRLDLNSFTVRLPNGKSLTTDINS